MNMKEWVRLNDWAKVARHLKKRHPGGMVGERDELITELVNVDKLSHQDAVRAAVALEEAGHAHHLPSERSCWLFTRQPVALRNLMQGFDEEYAEFVGHSENPREEMLEFIGAQLNVDEDVAEEVLAGFESAGYSSVVYDPNLTRDRMLMKFPEAFLPM